MKDDLILLESNFCFPEHLKTAIEHKYKKIVEINCLRRCLEENSNAKSLLEELNKQYKIIIIYLKCQKEHKKIDDFIDISIKIHKIVKRMFVVEFENILSYDTDKMTEIVYDFLDKEI